MLDHLGLPDVTRGTADPGFAAVIEFGRRGGYIKLSGAFRSSRLAFPHPDLDPFVAAIVAAFAPERRVFGSDWPFVHLSRKPAFADTLAMLTLWLPDLAERQLALVETPQRLLRLSPAA